MDDFKLFMPEKLTCPEQYRQWAILAKLFLENAECLEHIEDAVPDPSAFNPAERKAWKKGRAKTVLYLAKMIGGDVEIFAQNENLIEKGDPKLLWTKIKEKFYVEVGYPCGISQCPSGCWRSRGANQFYF
jgi:hypothetical protein